MQGQINITRVQVEFGFSFSVSDKVNAEHSVSEAAGGHSWRACSCGGKQCVGGLVSPLKWWRSRCVVTLKARGHPCRYLQAFKSQCVH